MIHFSDENPEDHFGFREEVPLSKTERGKHCIKAYGLDREKLNDARRQYLHKVKLNLFVASLDFDNMSANTRAETLGILNSSLEEAKELVNAAKLFLSVAAKSQAPYAGMVRANFQGLAH